MNCTVIVLSSAPIDVKAFHAESDTSELKADWVGITYVDKHGGAKYLSVFGTPSQLLQIADAVRERLLCSDCREAPVFADGLCEHCYREAEERALVEPIDIRP